MTPPPAFSVKGGFILIGMLHPLKMKGPLGRKRVVG